MKRSSQAQPRRRQSTVRKIAKPGAAKSHQEPVVMNCCPSEIIRPHEVPGGWMPIPRKLNPASASITVENSNTVITMRIGVGIAEVGKKVKAGVAVAERGKEVEEGRKGGRGGGAKVRAFEKQIEEGEGKLEVLDEYFRDIFDG